MEKKAQKREKGMGTIRSHKETRSAGFWGGGKPLPESTELTDKITKQKRLFGPHEENARGKGVAGQARKGGYDLNKKKHEKRQAHTAMEKKQ